MADEARSLKAYGELPDTSASLHFVQAPPSHSYIVGSDIMTSLRGINYSAGCPPFAVRVNETDTFDEERGENDDFFDFGATMLLDSLLFKMR